MAAFSRCKLTEGIVDKNVLRSIGFQISIMAFIVIQRRIFIITPFTISGDPEAPCTVLPAAVCLMASSRHSSNPRAQSRFQLTSPIHKSCELPKHTSRNMHEYKTHPLPNRLSNNFSTPITLAASTSIGARSGCTGGIAWRCPSQVLNSWLA